MNSQKPEISVIICTYNRCGVLVHALNSILAQTLSPDRFEIIVVDNNSKDGTRERVEKVAAQARPAVRYLFEGKQGKSSALNHGIREARGRILAFTDDDVRVAPDWLERISHYFTSYQTDMLSGRVIAEWDGAWPKWFRPEYRGVIVEFSPSPEVCFADCRWVALPPGANMAARSDVFERYGGFRADLSDGSLHRGEDSELTGRVLKLGGKILYCPDVVVFHPVTPERLTRRYVRWWYTTQGMAKSRLREEVPHNPTILNIPRWMYRQALEHFLQCVVHYTISPWGREAFYHEIHLWRFYGFAKDRWARRGLRKEGETESTEKRPAKANL